MYWDRRLGDQAERPEDDTETLEAAKREPHRLSAFEGANVEDGTCHGTEAQKRPVISQAGLGPIAAPGQVTWSGHALSCSRSELEFSRGCIATTFVLAPPLPSRGDMCARSERTHHPHCGDHLDPDGPSPD
jgi:hypothetical protein